MWEYHLYIYKSGTLIGWEVHYKYNILLQPILYLVPLWHCGHRFPQFNTKPEAFHCCWELAPIRILHQCYISGKVVWARMRIETKFPGMACSPLHQLFHIYKLMSEWWYDCAYSWALWLAGSCILQTRKVVLKTTITASYWDCDIHRSMSHWALYTVQHAQQIDEF